MKLAIAYICVSLFFVLLRGKLFYRSETRKQTIFNSIRVCAEMFALTWMMSYFTWNPPPSTKHVLFAAILWGAIFAWKFLTFKKTGSQPTCKWSLAFPITLFAILFIRVSAIWILRTFPLNDVESVITTLSLPLDGFTVIFIRVGLAAISKRAGAGGNCLKLDRNAYAVGRRRIFNDFNR